MIYSDFLPAFAPLLEEHDIRHFHPSEIVHLRAGVPPRELWPNILPTLAVAERIRGRLRVHVDRAVILVTSGYRSPEYNERVGGAPESLHVEFNALDIWSPQVPAGVLADYARSDPDAARMGIGEYPGFVHIDTRGHLGRKAPARW